MTVWRTIYERYCEGDLDIKPPLQTVYSELRLKTFEDDMGITGDMAREKFENMLSVLCIEGETRGFYAAVKIMVRMISE